MGEEFIAEEVIHRHVTSGLSGPDVDLALHPCLGIFLGENRRGLSDGLNDEGLEYLVLVVTENHADNLLVLQDAESAEEDEQGNLTLHTGNSGTEIHDLLILWVVLNSH